MSVTVTEFFLLTKIVRREESYKIIIWAQKPWLRSAKKRLLNLQHTSISKKGCLLATAIYITRITDFFIFIFCGKFWRSQDVLLCIWFKLNCDLHNVNKQTDQINKRIFCKFCKTKVHVFYKKKHLWKKFYLLIFKGHYHVT